jgi:hypothetical protein
VFAQVPHPSIQRIEAADLVESAALDVGEIWLRLKGRAWWMAS